MCATVALMGTRKVIVAHRLICWAQQSEVYWYDTVPGWHADTPATPHLRHGRGATTRQGFFPPFCKLLPAAFEASCAQLLLHLISTFLAQDFCQITLACRQAPLVHSCCSISSAHS